MASSPNPTDQNFIVVDFHYNGQFAPNPLVYFDPDKALVRDVDFSGFGYEQFMEFLHKLTKSRSKDIYFCLPQESLSLGIHTLVNEGDYKEFLDLAYANDKRMNVYVDHHNKPIFDWIEAEESESENEDLDEDEDSVIQDSCFVDHEEDDATYPFPANKTAHDRFLNILCEPTKSEDQDDEYVSPQYPVYDEREPWDQMKPIIGMRFSNPTELKHMLSNYAVASGSNHGSTVRLDVDIMPDSTTLFSKFYVCFKVVRDGWLEGCRPVIGLDGCFLKGIVRGEVLSAVGRDANNNLYPLAWAVVCVENKKTWKWFIDLLMDDINGGLGAGITLLSDGHKAEILLPGLRHSFKKEEIVMQWRMGLWGVTPCGYQKYEVRFTDVAYGVDLIAKKCACRIWQLTRIPCLHGVAAISYLNHDAETYVSQSYTTEAYLKCYKYSINPLNSSDMWPDVPYHKPLPPKRRRLPSRPSVKRKRDAIERELTGPSRQTVSRRGSLIKCGICKELGHNKKKCPSNHQSNTSVPSSSRDSGANPSLSRGNEGPPPTA
uniref:SWIM-type domain-containing protein n=1 Tax=Lactuca sativa TaxID=4236 RepID=A0A9R1V2W2_LACSA|nr:hypothetical protein LSAT_V11C600326040 [Lactuca sativa]